MSFLRFRYCLRLFTVPAFALLLIGCWFLHSARVEGQVAQGGKVRELQEQRVETLRDLLKMTAEHYKTGLANFEELAAATRAKNMAELDLCSSNTQRVAVLEKIVANARALEAQQAKLAANKLVPETTLLKARADRLQQEILLEQARAR